MTFYNIFFILYFLTPFLVVYYLVPNRLKNIVLFMASVIFGIFSGPEYYLIPVGSVAVNYILGRLLGKRHSHLLLVLGTIVNTAAPIVFRISFNDQILQNNPVLWLMFFASCMCSLRALTYFVDLYKGTTAIQPNPFRFANFMLYFPTFTAGPLVDYNDFRIQLRKRHHTGTAFLVGTVYFVCGVLKKVILADRLGVLWKMISTSDYTVLTTANALLGLVGLILYIVLSVSAYWDCAVGLSRIVGFEVSREFHPIKFIRKAGAAAIVYIFPIIAAAVSALSFADWQKNGTYLKALTKGTGFSELSFLYHFASNRILLLVSVLIALHLPWIVVRLIGALIDKLRKGKRKKDSWVSRITAIVLIAAMLCIISANRIFKERPAIVPSETPWYIEIPEYENRTFMWAEQLDMLNADMGVLMKMSGRNGIYYAENGVLIECPPAYDEGKVDAAIEMIDDISDKERFETHIALIPPAYEINADKLPPYAHDGRVKKTISRVYKLLDGSAIQLFDASGLLSENNAKGLYYNTMPRLTTEGTYIVYKAMTSQLGCKIFGYDTFNFSVGNDKCKGELWHKGRTHFTKTDVYTEPALVEVGMDKSVEVLSFDAQSGRSLVLITDNTAPGIERLFSKSFDTIYVFHAGTDKEYLKTKVKEYIEDKFVTDMLVVCSTDYLVD